MSIYSPVQLYKLNSNNGIAIKETSFKYFPKESIF